MAVVTTLGGIDVVGDGYDLIYVDDQFITRGDGNYEYTTGAANALAAYLDAKQQDINMNVKDKFNDEEIDELSIWWDDTPVSSLKEVLSLAEARGLQITSLMQD